MSMETISSRRVSRIATFVGALLLFITLSLGQYPLWGTAISRWQHVNANGGFADTEFRRTLHWLHVPSHVPSLLSADGIQIYAAPFVPNLADWHRLEFEALTVSLFFAAVALLSIQALTRIYAQLMIYAPARKLASEIRSHYPGSGAIPLGQVSVPEPYETRATIISGAPGSGKSQAIAGAVQAALRHSYNVVIVDRGAELVSKIKDATIFNGGFDSHGPDWSVLAEPRNLHDINALASMLYPQRGDGSAGDYFNAAAAVTYEIIMRFIWERSGTNSDLFKAFSDQRTLVGVLHGTPGEQYVRARNWGEIYSTLWNALKWLPYLPPRAGADAFSVTQFIQDCDHNRAAKLIFPIHKSMTETAAPVASLFVGLVAHSALALQPDSKRRIVLATDELGNMRTLSNFSHVVAEGRKHGLVPIVTVQSIAQLHKIYGHDGAQELLSCFQNWLILRPGDAVTAEAMSYQLGDYEALESAHSEGRGPGGQHKGKVEQTRPKRLVPRDVLLRLPDRVGYASIAPFPPVRVKIALTHLPDVVQPYEPVLATPKIMVTPQIAELGNAPDTHLMDIEAFKR